MSASISTAIFSTCSHSRWVRPDDAMSIGGFLGEPRGGVELGTGRDERGEAAAFVGHGFAFRRRIVSLASRSLSIVLSSALLLGKIATSTWKW